MRHHYIKTIPTLLLAALLSASLLACTDTPEPTAFDLEDYATALEDYLLCTDEGASEDCVSEEQALLDAHEQLDAHDEGLRSVVFVTCGPTPPGVQCQGDSCSGTQNVGCSCSSAGGGLDAHSCSEVKK